MSELLLSGLPLMPGAVAAPIGGKLAEGIASTLAGEAMLGGLLGAAMGGLLAVSDPEYYPVAYCLGEDCSHLYPVCDGIAQTVNQEMEAERATAAVIDRVDEVIQRPFESGDYVVRGGIATPDQLIKGTAEHVDHAGLWGFSVQYSPGKSVEELAKAGEWPNKKISVTTIGQLAAYDSDVFGSPYQLIAAPSVPVRVTELPEEIVRLVQQTTLKSERFLSLPTISSEALRSVLHEA